MISSHNRLLLLSITTVLNTFTLLQFKRFCMAIPVSIKSTYAYHFYSHFHSLNYVATAAADVAWGTLVSDATTSSLGGFHTNTSTFVCNIEPSVQSALLTHRRVLPGSCLTAVLLSVLQLHWKAPY